MQNAAQKERERKNSKENIRGREERKPSRSDI